MQVLAALKRTRKRWFQTTSTLQGQGLTKRQRVQTTPKWSNAGNIHVKRPHPKRSDAGNIHVKRPKDTRARIDERPESPNNCNVARARFDEKPESSSNANVTRARLDEKTKSPSNTLCFENCRDFVKLLSFCLHRQFDPGSIQICSYTS